MTYAINLEDAHWWCRRRCDQVNECPRGDGDCQRCEDRSDDFKEGV